MPSSLEIATRQERRVERARRAEREVARLLSRSGFQIVAMNLRLGYLEIDIVARRGDLVVVVEVRARSGESWTTGFGSITAAKRRRVRRAAERLWRRRYHHDPTVTRLRIDAAAVFICGERMTVRYCAGAF